MTNEAKTYQIRTLIDMVAIPPDRFPAFLEELTGWHKGMHDSGANELFAMMAKAGAPQPELTLDWCDDNDPGLREVNINITMRKE